LSHPGKDDSDKSIRGFNGKLISTYFGHLKVANEEINAFWKSTLISKR
jgi:hypothetical protein